LAEQERMAADASWILSHKCHCQQINHAMCVL